MKADTLTAYSIQNWLESAPQGYLENTEYGHEAGVKEPDFLIENPSMRQRAIRQTVQLVVGERCALAASSGLINCAPEEASKRFLATQTLDEARHVEVFTQRLFDLGVKRAELEGVLEAHANPYLVKFAEVLLEKVDKKDFIAGVVGQNIVLEGMAFHVFELNYAGNKDINPKFAQTLKGTIADERRHVGFGEARIGQLIREHPERKDEVQRMQRDMSYFMLATFAEAFKDSPDQAELDRIEARQAAGPVQWQGKDISHLAPKDMEHLLADTILGEFKKRLERIGLEYQTPPAPEGV
jgi:pyrroloquinoline quinone (PQQ) biosynthesis protein C